MITSYPFTKAVQTLQLENEIKASAIVTAIQSIVLNGANDLNVSFKDALSSGDETILNALVSVHTPVALINEPLLVQVAAPATSTGLPKVSIYEPEGASSTIISHGFSDKCSWYQGAIQVTMGSLNNSGLVYSDPNNKTHWIDLEHGRLYDEDNIMTHSSPANKYKVKVYVGGILVTTGFTIDYTAGTVTFASDPAGVVTASYWYADKSWYCIRPKVGKILSIKAAEVQFSANTNLVPAGAFVFAPWFVGHPVYGTMEIPGQRIVYKNAKDFISACNGGQGVIPKWGELTEDVHVFPFNYVRPKPIKYSEYIEIRVYCSAHEPIAGEFATATFYVTIDNE